MSKRRVWANLPLILAGFFAALPAASAQIDITKLSSIRGVIRDENKQPIPNAVIDLDSVQTDSRTRPDGSFSILGLTPGVHLMSVRNIGFEPVSWQFRLEAGKTLEVNLTLPRVYTLETKVITGASKLRLDFEDRRRRRAGSYLDSAQLSKRYDVFSALQRVSLVRVTTAPSGDRVVQVRDLSSRRACRPGVFLDGLISDYETIGHLIPSSLRAIEVFSTENVPAQFMSPYGGPTNRSCGVILVWTRSFRW